MTAEEEIRTVVMIADQTIGISAGRAMVIEMGTVHNNRVRDHVDHSKIEDHNKVDLVDHSNNRDKDLHRKIADLDKVKDLVAHNKIEGHNKTVDHSNSKDQEDHNKIEDLNSKDLVDPDHLRDKILANQIHHKPLHRPHRQRKDKP